MKPAAAGCEVSDLHQPCGDECRVITDVMCGKKSPGPTLRIPADRAVPELFSPCTAVCAGALGCRA